MITINDPPTISAEENGESLNVAHLRPTMGGCPLLPDTTVRQALYGAFPIIFGRCNIHDIFSSERC